MLENFVYKSMGSQELLALRFPPRIVSVLFRSDSYKNHQLSAHCAQAHPPHPHHSDTRTIKNMPNGILLNDFDAPRNVPCPRDTRVTYSSLSSMPASAGTRCAYCFCRGTQVKQRINPLSLMGDRLTGTVTLYESCQKANCVLTLLGSMTYHSPPYSVQGYRNIGTCIPNVGDQRSVIWRPSRKAYQCCRIVGITINNSGELGAVCCKSNQGKVGKCRDSLKRKWSELEWDESSIGRLKFLPVADATRFDTAISVASDLGVLGSIWS